MENVQIRDDFYSKKFYQSWFVQKLYKDQIMKNLSNQANVLQKEEFIDKISSKEFEWLFDSKSLKSRFEAETSGVAFATPGEVISNKGPPAKLALKERGLLFQFLDLKTLANQTAKLSKADRNYITTSPAMFCARRTLTFDHIPDYDESDLKQLELACKVATHFNIKIIQFNDRQEIEILNVLLSEGRHIPKKFFFVTLYLQFDEDTKMEYMNLFS